jgi:hypothetical protein
VDAVVYYRVSNATIAVANVENAHHSTRLLAQTALRNLLGTRSLSQILSDRDSIAESMQVFILYHSLNIAFSRVFPWCIKTIDSISDYLMNHSFKLCHFRICSEVQHKTGESKVSPL